MKFKNKTRRCFFVDDELWEQITIAARLDGRSVSSWLRSRAETALAKEIRRVVTPMKPTDLAEKIRAHAPEPKKPEAK